MYTLPPRASPHSQALTGATGTPLWPANRQSASQLMTSEIWPKIAIFWSKIEKFASRGLCPRAPGRSRAAGP